MPRDLMKVVESSPAELDAPTLCFVQESAETIRGLVRKTGENIVRIGEHLSAVKERLGHGNWLPWLEGEFGWSEPTAQRFMRVQEMVRSKSVKLTDLPAFDVSALYLLAAPSTPEPVRQIASKVAAEGGKVTHKLVKQQIAQVQAVRLASDPPITDIVADPAGELHSEPQGVSAVNDAAEGFDIKAQLASIDKALADAMRAREEAAKLAVERQRIDAERLRLEELRVAERAKIEAERLRLEHMRAPERAKMGAEYDRINAQTRKLLRETMTEPWKIVIGGMTAGAALFAAGGALVKLLLP